MSSWKSLNSESSSLLVNKISIRFYTFVLTYTARLASLRLTFLSLVTSHNVNVQFKRVVRHSFKFLNSLYQGMKGIVLYL